jgi:hypothetical protein
MSNAALNSQAIEHRLTTEADKLWPHLWALVQENLRQNHVQCFALERTCWAALEREWPYNWRSFDGVSSAYRILEGLRGSTGDVQQIAAQIEEVERMVQAEVDRENKRYAHDKTRPSLDKQVCAVLGAQLVAQLRKDGYRHACIGSRRHWRHGAMDTIELLPWWQRIFDNEFESIL